MATTSAGPKRSRIRVFILPLSIGIEHRSETQPDLPTTPSPRERYRSACESHPLRRPIVNSACVRFGRLPGPCAQPERLESRFVLFAVLLLLVGAAVLTTGAESAIRGAARFAEARRISPFVLGALLFGVDLESLGAALIAAGKGQTSIAAGEAFGTIVFLFSAAFGAALLVSPRPIESPGTLMVLLPAGTLAMGAIALADS